MAWDLLPTGYFTKSKRFDLQICHMSVNFCQLFSLMSDYILLSLLLCVCALQSPESEEYCASSCESCKRTKPSLSGLAATPQHNGMEGSSLSGRSGKMKTLWFLCTISHGPPSNANDFFFFHNSSVDPRILKGEHYLKTKILWGFFWQWHGASL